MVGWSIKWFIIFIILAQVSAAVENTDNNGSNVTIEENIMSINPLINATNANFYIINAIVIVEDSAGNKVVNVSDANGKAYVRVSPGQAIITVKADGYEEFDNKSVIISENATFTYVLIPSIDKTFWYWIAWLLPLFAMLFFILTEWPEMDYHWYAYLPVILWATSFGLLIYVSVDANYDVFFLDPRLKVSLFVPIAAFLGAASHITMSILNNLERKPLTSAWKRIYFAFGRRLLIAPYIAIIALFTITGVGDINNMGGVLFFAYFVGLYTKNIEGTLQEIGKKFLTDKQKTQLEENESEAIDIVKRLGVSANVYDKLVKQDIKNIGDLLSIDPDKINDFAEKTGVEETYLTELVEKAKAQDTDIQEMKEKLGLDDDLLNMLIDAGLYSLNELSGIDSNCLSQIAENIGISKECLEGIVHKAKRRSRAFELVKRLGVSANVYEKLSKKGIKSIDDLIDLTDKKIEDLKAEITEIDLIELRTKAIAQDTEIQEMKEKLSIDDELINMLVNAGFHSMNELGLIDSKCLSEIAENIGIGEECLEGIVHKAKGRSRAFELVKRLGVNANVYGKLVKQDIKNIDDLLAITPKKITTITKSEGLDPNYLPELKIKATVQDKEIKEMKEKLGLDYDLLNMLIDEGFYSMNEISLINENCQSKIAENIGISNECLNKIVQNAKYEINNLYLFSWDDITKNDYEKLKESLKKNYDIDWIKTATFKRKDNGKILNVSFKNKFLSLKLNDEQTEVSLEIKDEGTYKLIPRKENGKINIYGHFNP
jgi:hypothetical protein